jgi:hypothetical protein
LALNPATAYPSQVDLTDTAGYPYGRAKNVTSIGDGTGTPLEQKWVSDLFGFEQALLAAVAATPSGTADKVGASQYLDAILSLADTRAKNALQVVAATNWPERASGPGSIAAVNSEIGMVWAPAIGLWCVVDAARTVYTSADGLIWNSVATLGSSASTVRPNVAYGMLDGSPVLIASGGSGLRYYTSPDGTAWTDVAGTGASVAGLFAHSQTLNRWVCVSSVADYALATSVGFASWTVATVPSAWTSSSGGCKRLMWNGSLFVALPAGSYNKVLTSADGITWTERTLPFAASWTGLAYSAKDGMWMATNTGAGNCATSPDGLTWSTPTGTNYTYGNDLACYGSLWVMPTENGNFGGIAWSVNKGASWTRGPNVGKHSIATAGWRRICVGDSRFMMAHETGTNIEFALSIRPF